MEGLEITIKTLREINGNNPTYRLDSEFFKKEYLLLYEKLFLRSCDKLENLSAWITQGPNPVFSESEIPCLTGRNINKGRVNYNNADYVSEDEYHSLKRFQLKPGDTLITLKGKGSIGKVGYVTDQRKAIFSRDIGVIRPDKINSAYVNAYMLSKFGVKIIERGETGGTGQSTLTASYLRNIDIPRMNIENEVGQLVIRSENILNLSLQTYKNAEDLFLEAVGFKNFESNKEPINIKGLNESFLNTGRLDAEYYQKKYEDYLNLIYKYPNGFKPLIQVCTLKDSNYTPSDLLDYKYIELSNIGNTGEITGCSNEIGQDLPSRARRKVNAGDVVISSIEGSLQSCAIVDKEYDNSLCSTGFYVINSSVLNSETLLVLFKSEPTQNILKQNCSGTILTAINKNEFLNIPIPLVQISVQEKIAELIKESFILKRESEKLLNIAKKAVEIAIEEGDERSIFYIENNVLINGK